MGTSDFMLKIVVRMTKQSSGAILIAVTLAIFPWGKPVASAAPPSIRSKPKPAAPVGPTGPVNKMTQAKGRKPLVAFTGADTYGKRALVIGIEGYDGEFGRLACSNADAHQMGAMLRNEWGYPSIQVDVVTDEAGNQPRRLSRGYLARKIRNFVDQIRENDSVVFYFSGHGFSEGEQDYLVPLGGSTKDAEDSCISMNDIIKDIDEKKPLKALIIADACRTDPTTKKGFVPVRPFGIGTSHINTEKDFVVLRSCGRGQTSAERTDRRGGVFTTCLLEATKPENAKAGEKVNYERLILRVQEKVSQYLKSNPKPEEAQVPEGNSNRGNILIYSWKYPPPPEPPLPIPSPKEIAIANHWLAIAMNQSDYRKVRNLIRRGANAWNTPNKGGAPKVVSNVLGWVAYMDDIDTFKLLFQRSKGISANSPDFRMYTPLHMAAIGNARLVAGYLLYWGANRSAKTADGDEPLHLAILQNSVDVARLLLSKDEGLAQNVSVRYGTPLRMAIDRNNLDLIELLLPYYPDYAVKGNESYDILHGAVLANRLELVHLLLQHHADPNSSLSNEFGQPEWQRETPLHNAAEQPDVKMVQMLLDYGANPNFRSGLGETPLHKAVWRGNFDVVKLLLRNRADINSIADGGTPLDFAERYNRPEIEKFLAEQGGKHRKELQ